MRTNGSTLIAVLILTSLPASAFRDDLPQDPATDCAATPALSSPEYGEACALAAFADACRESDRDTLVARLSAPLGVHGIQVQKAIGRHLLSNRGGDLCEWGETERRQVIAAARQPKSARSESPKDWLLKELSGPDGTIDHAAVASAVAERDALLADALKRAGLPALPSGWTNLTGYTQSAGRINHILFTSGTGNDILAGADGGGIWRSADAGANWTAVNDALGSLSITNFAMTTNDANTIYAATNQRGSHTYFPYGILKSTNGGTSWSQIAATNPSTNADFTYVQRIAVHPTNSSIVLAATESGAYQSIDGGANWTKLGGIATRAYYVAIHPTDGNRRAAAYNDGTIRYTTTGDLHGAGASTATVLAGGTYMKTAYAKSDTSRMYALVTDGSSYASRLWTSATGGASWTEIDTATLRTNYTFYDGGYLSYTGGLWVDPLNANRVAVCEAWAAFTADVSAVPATWKKLYSGWVDFHGIVEHPGYNGTTNRTVFFMDDGGLYRVTDVDALDTFASFTRLDAGMTVTEVYSVAGFGGNPILGAQDVAPRVYRTDLPGDATTKWRFSNRPVGDPLCSGCSWIGDGATTAASTASSAVLYGSRQYLDFFRSTDGGVTSTSLAYNSALTDGRGATAPNYNAAFIAPYVLDPSNQSRMLAGGLSLWRSTNADSGTPPAWTAIRGPFTDASCGTYQPAINVIAISPSNPDVVWIAYAGCVSRVFKSVNATLGAPTFTEVTTLPSGALNRVKGSITLHPTDPNTVWLGLGQYTTSTLFKTTDGGATSGGWTTVSGLPGAPVYSMKHHPMNSQWMYAATGVGLFASDDGGATWSASNEGPANVVMRSLSWYSTGTSADLLVGTFGRGVWKATVTTAVARKHSDFSADGRSDVFWRDTAGGLDYQWQMNGFAISGQGYLPTVSPNWSVVGLGDVNNDTRADVLWREGAGLNYLWMMNGLTIASQGYLPSVPNPWIVVGMGDADGDGRADVFWRNPTSGQNYLWILNGQSITSQGYLPSVAGSDWEVVGVADYNGDTKADVLWRNKTSGQNYLWIMNGLAVSSQGYLPTVTPVDWEVAGSPDANGDGRADVLWRNKVSGQMYLWLMNGFTIASQGYMPSVADANWKVAGFGDYNGDGKGDVLWRHATSGQNYLWTLNGISVATQGYLPSVAGANWQPVKR